MKAAQAWRFSSKTTGGAPLVTLISPSMMAPSATAIELPDKLPMIRAVPEDFDALLRDDVAFDDAGYDDVGGLQGALPMPTGGERQRPLDVAIAFDRAAEDVSAFARDRSDDRRRGGDVRRRAVGRVLDSSFEQH